MDSSIRESSIDDLINNPELFAELYGECGECICGTCLYRWSSRCPHGSCYDDLRAREHPYDKVYPERSPRKEWTNWNKPGEQAHWCRGGVFYPSASCDQFVRYEGSRVEECVEAPIEVFQDDYIICSYKDFMGCEACVTKKNKSNIFNCHYMTDSGCDKLIESKNRMLDAIAAGEQIDPCREQCCIGCTRQCIYRCGVRG